MSINSIENTTRYTAELDKMFAQKSATGFFADSTLATKFVGARLLSSPMSTSKVLQIMTVTQVFHAVPLQFPTLPTPWLWTVPALCRLTERIWTKQALPTLQVRF